jgi:hypothetical protein
MTVETIIAIVLTTIIGILLVRGKDVRITAVRGLITVYDRNDDMTVKEDKITMSKIFFAYFKFVLKHKL